MDRLQVRQQIWGALCGVARPDNGLDRQRAQALPYGKVALVTTYGIRRGAAVSALTTCRPAARRTSPRWS
jgi:hypothetical protein